MVAQEEVESPPSPVVNVSPTSEVEPRAAGTIYKVAIGTPLDGTLARDVVYVTPHLQDNAGTLSPAQIATQLATAMGTYMRTPSAGGTLKLYLEDFNPGAPHPPLASATWGTGTLLSSVGPREIALCLSYYAAFNQKRFRGRLYIPHAWLNQNQATPLGAPGVRPTASAQTAAMNLYTQVIAQVKASGVQWVVASRVDKAPKVVSDYWVDDEWDVQRRRGLRGLTRTTGKVT